MAARGRERGAGALVLNRESQFCRMMRALEREVRAGEHRALCFSPLHCTLKNGEHGQHSMGSANQTLQDNPEGWDGGGGGGSFTRQGICVCLLLIHADIWQKPVQHCKVIIFQLKIGLKKE